MVIIVLIITEVFEVSKVIEDKEYYNKINKVKNLYEDGESCQRNVKRTSNGE